MKLSDLKLLSKDTLIYGIGNASNQIIRVLLAPLYVAYLAADLYGVRSITAAFYRFLQIIILFALNQAVIADYYKATSEEERRRLVSTAFTYTLVASLLFGGLLLVFAPLLSHSSIVQRIIGLESAELRSILRLFGIYTVGNPAGLIFLALLRSEKRPGMYSIFTISTSLVRVAMTIVFLVVLGRGLQGLYEVDVLFVVPVLLVTSAFVYIYSRGIKFSFASLKSMLAYSLPLIPTSLFFWGRGMLDRLLFIPLYLTHTDVGIFAFALNFHNIVSFILVVPLSLAWLPYAFSVKEQPDLPDIISRVLTYFLFLAGWALVILGGAASEILRLIAKRPEYWQGAPLVPLLVLGVYLYAVYLILGTACHLQRKTIYFTLVTFIGAGVAVGANVILLPRIGLLGAAIASAASYGAMALSMFFFSRRLMKIPFETKRIVLIALISTGITAASYFWHVSSPLVGFLLKLGLGSAAYLGILFLLGFLLPSERDFIRNLLRRAGGKAHTKR
ncbi:hypothetical protein ES703_00983 [subsurface metagenome]